MQLPKGTKLNKMECGVIWAKRYVYHMANKDFDHLDVIDAYKCFLVELYGFADNRLAVNTVYDSFVSDNTATKEEWKKMMGGECICYKVGNIIFI